MSWIREGELNLLEKISANVLKVSLIYLYILKYLYFLSSPSFFFSGKTENEIFNWQHSEKKMYLMSQVVPLFNKSDQRKKLEIKSPC